MNCGREGSCPHRSSRVQEGGRPQQFACAQDEGAWPCAGWPSRVVSTRCGPPCACVESGSVRQGRVGWRANTSRRTTSWWQQQAAQLTTSSELDEMSVRARAQNVAKEERRASATSLAVQSITTSSVEGRPSETQGVIPPQRAQGQQPRCQPPPHTYGHARWRTLCPTTGYLSALSRTPTPLTHPRHDGILLTFVSSELSFGLSARLSTIDRSIDLGWDESDE